MKNLNIRALLLSFVATLSVYIGCVRPDPILPENYLKYPLDVKVVELPDGSFKLTWNAIKSADFLEYRVLKNTGDTVPFIGDSLINNLSKFGKTLELAKRIESIDSTFFIDSFSVPATKTFMRVFAVLKDRNVSSRNVEIAIKTDSREMEINPNDILYLSEDRKIVVGDQVLNRMGIYDIANNSVSNVVQNVTFTNNLEMNYGRFNNVTELYVPTNFNFNPQVQVRNLSGNIIASSSPGFIANDAILCDKINKFNLSITAFPPTIRIFSRLTTINTGTPLLSSMQFPTPLQQAFYVFRPVPNNSREAIAVSITNNNADLIWFKYDSLGRSVTKINGLNTFRINITKRPFSMAPDNQGFITSGRGLIFNRAMALVDSLKLPSSEVRYVDMIYSNDGKNLYAVRNPTERSEKFVDVFAYPGYKFVRSIPFQSTPLRIFQDGTDLVLVGRSPNTARLVMFEKVKL
jgi:hypothetical protein